MVHRAARLKERTCKLEALRFKTNAIRDSLETIDRVLRDNASDQ